MKTTTRRAALKKMSSKLLDLSFEDKEQVEKTINEICYLYQEVSGITGTQTDTEYIVNVPTEVGVSLSLNHAASCMTDYKRTHKLLKGIVQAIRDKQDEHPGETIRVFYAGCGPFALFMTMVAPLFNPTEIQFTLLEVNTKSMAIARQVIANLELEDSLDECHTADAITFQVPNAQSYHILFSETLDSLLNREGYVPILWNLLPQLRTDITVIPNNVQVKVNYKNDKGELPFAIAFDTREKLKNTPKTNKLPEQLAPSSFSLADAKEYDSLLIDTEVQVYGDIVLRRGESSISLALEVPIQKNITDEFVDFIYRISPTPGLQIATRQS